jgi:hypothetical protein
MVFLAILLVVVGVQLLSIGLIGELLINQSPKLKKNEKISIEKILNR